MKNVMRLFLSVLIFSCAIVQAKQMATIERYEAERDLLAIQRILADYPYLTYESFGKPEGATEKYLGSPNYITEVLRVNDQTVGFINYCAHDLNILTFHIKRYGLIHLLGVDRQHQCKGYGTMLLTHALAKLETLHVPRILLNVKSDNAVARALYEKFGFVCTVPGALQTKMPALMYERYVSVPADQLPQGNLVQQYPGTTLVLTCVLGLLYWFRPRAR